MVAFEEVKSAINDGAKMLRRKCSLCGEPIYYALKGGKPCLEVCSCRESGRRDLVPMSLDDLHELVEGGK